MSLAKNIFETTEVVRDVVKRIMMQAQELLDCERCIVYLVDTEVDESQVSPFSVDLKFCCHNRTVCYQNGQ